MDKTQQRIREVVYDMCPEKGQTGFAEELGFSQSTVNSWCIGRTLPSSFALICIAEKCNVSADWLLGLSDVKKIRCTNERIENG